MFDRNLDHLSMLFLTAKNFLQFSRLICPAVSGLSSLIWIAAKFLTCPLHLIEIVIVFLKLSNVINFYFLFAKLKALSLNQSINQLN